MTDLPDISDAQPDERTDEQVLGLISRMLDGDITTFRYQHLQVARDGESIYVYDPETGDRLGGRWLVTTTNPRPVLEWLEAKANSYRHRRVSDDPEVIA